jgi:catechol 2,3-dioxygenase
VTTAFAAVAGALRAEGQISTSTGMSTSMSTPAEAGIAADIMPFALTTPMHVGQAALKVRDLTAMSAYYRSVLGFEPIAATDKEVTLGAGGVALLHLIHAPDAGFESQSAAGLFHIAYLMPTRKDLARWLVHVARMRVPLTGFADHSVSEAIYLNDPEGNGIEVYSDRPREKWTWDGDVVTMGTKQLDIDSIVALTDPLKDDYNKAPSGLRIGHMHLRVGEIAKARSFYESAVGLQSTRGNRPDAAFLSSGRYHHHVAMNTWNSQGAGARNGAETGLDWFSLRVDSQTTLSQQQARLSEAGFTVTALKNGVLEAFDPWGTKLRLEIA